MATTIQLKRTTDTLGITQLAYGEPLFVKGKYLVFGDGDPSHDTASYPRLKFTTTTELSEQGLYYKKNTDGSIILVNDAGETVSLLSKSLVGLDTVVDKDSTGENTATSKAIYEAIDKAKGEAKVLVYEDSTDEIVYLTGVVKDKFSDGYKYNKNIYMDCAKGVMYGAAWNDIAEYRKCAEEAGTVVCEVGNGKLEKSEKKLQAGAYIISDTFGFAIGEKEDSKPVAIAGRVLAKYNGSIEKYVIGKPVCAGKNGKIEVMSRLNAILFPDRILGFVSELPMYEKYNDTVVGDRIWITIK